MHVYNLANAYAYLCALTLNTCVEVYATDFFPLHVSTVSDKSLVRVEGGLKVDLEHYRVCIVVCV